MSDTPEVPGSIIPAPGLITRRTVLKRTALAGGAVMLTNLLACSDDFENPLAPKPEEGGGVVAEAMGSEPFLSQIGICSFNFPPKGWALCNGQFLPINQNQALFALLGTTYGGNGQTNFQLPNLRGRVPMHVGGGHSLGEAAGSTSVTVNIQQLPTHTHALMGSATAGDTPDPTSHVLASTPALIYGAPTALAALNPVNVTSVGGSQPHNNMMPYLVLTFCIALQGIFPSQN